MGHMPAAKRQSFSEEWQGERAAERGGYQSGLALSASSAVPRAECQAG